MKRWLFLLIVGLHAFMMNGAAAKTMPPPATADLSIESIATSQACVHGKPCIFHVIFRNQGSAPYRGPIAFTDDVSALTLLAEPLPSPWTCLKTGRGQFTCRHPNAVVEPGRRLSLTVMLKVIGSSFGRMEHCGIIDWGDHGAAVRNQAVRQRLDQIGYPIRDERTLAAAIRDFKAKASIAPGDQSDAELVASLIGPWGEGDSFAGNDRGCVSFELLETIKKPLERCRAGDGLIGGKCVALASYCPGGQVHDAASASCQCPAGRPVWVPATGQCQASGIGEACKPGQSMAKGECLCPAETPVWNARQSRCVAIDILQFAAASSKTDLAPACSGGRILDRSGTDCICPAGFQESPGGCVRQARAAPPQRPIVKRPIIRLEQERRGPNCRGAQVWSRSLGRCVRLAATERQCGKGQIRRNGKCLWPKRAQAQRPVARKTSVADRPQRPVKQCDGLTRWSQTLRGCIPFWILIP